MKRRSLATFVAAALLLGTAPVHAVPACGQRCFDADLQASVDRLMRDALERHEFPGAQLIITIGGRTIVRKAYGDRTLEPKPRRTDLTTIYELASLTKPVATATAIMLLVQRGQLRLRDRVASIVPDFGQNGKANVSIEQLLTHTAGMPPVYDESDYSADLATILHHADGMALRFEPGTKFEYSNLGYIILAEVVAKRSGMPFERFVQRELFAPLHMDDSSFDTTIDASHRARLAPQIRAQSEAGLRKAFGTVPGVNGHSGMLSTADDLARYATALLAGTGPLAPASLRVMIEPHYVGNHDVRGLGWDLDSAFSGNRGDLLPRGGFGHTGSSGTSLWIDPALRVSIVFVSNAHYPDDTGFTIPIEAKLANAVAAAAIHHVDDARVQQQEQHFDAAAARSALGFPASPGPAPTATPAAKGTP